MASRRAWLPSRVVLVSIGVDSASGSLHWGQRLAKPGLPGFNSNSSLQIAQILIGKAMQLYDNARAVVVEFTARTAAPHGSKTDRVISLSQAWSLPRGVDPKNKPS